MKTRNRRGFATVMIVALSVIITGYIMTLAWAASVQSQVSSNMIRVDANYYAAEAGLQRAAWYIKNSVAVSQPLTGSINGSTYSVTWAAGSGSSQRITSVATNASAKSTVLETLIPAATVAPGFAIGGGLGDAGALTIAGTVAVVGNVTRSGTMVLTNVAGMGPSSLQAMGQFLSAGTFIIPGNLQFNNSIISSGSVTTTGNVQSGGSITHAGTWNVSGSTQAHSSPNLSITAPTVDTATLIAQASSGGKVMPGGTYSNLTIDFTQSPNGIVYINGNTTVSGTTTVKGSGTLVIQGSLTAGGYLGTLASPAPINIVTTGDATMSGTAYTTGCLCAGGNLIKSGTTVIDGVVVVQSNVTGSGSITLTYAPPPSFIHYTGSGGGTGSSSTMQFTNFAGPTP